MDDGFVGVPGLDDGPGVDVSGLSGVAVLVVLALALVVGAAVWQHRRRVEVLRQRRVRAEAAGWTFTPSADELVDAWRCDPFGTGRGRRAENRVSGTYRGVPFSAFEYRYYTETHSTDAQGHQTTHRHDHRFDVAVLHLRAPVPDLDLRPEGVLTRLASALGGRDVDLEWEDFNRAYRVRCDDRKFAFDTLPPATMEYLVARGRVRFCLTGGDAVVFRQGDGGDPTIWGPGDPATALEQSSAPLDVVLTVLRGIPSFVWQDRGGLPPALVGAQW